MDGNATLSRIFYWLRVVTVGRRPGWTVIRIVLLVTTVFVTARYILVPVRIVGPSMEPTLHNGSINVVNRLAYIFDSPHRGDIVGIRMSPGDGFTTVHDMLMKRVVGLPGEGVAFQDGHIWINGVRQEEPYLRFHSVWTVPERKLGLHEYYVVGDNRSMPIEDHDQGIAQRGRIVGKALVGGSGR